MNAGSGNEHFLSHSKFEWETALFVLPFDDIQWGNLRAQARSGVVRKRRSNTCSTHFFEKIISPLLSLLSSALAGREKESFPILALPSSPLSWLEIRDHRTGRKEVPLGPWTCVAQSSSSSSGRPPPRPPPPPLPHWPPPPPPKAEKKGQLPRLFLPIF